jgi:choline dehydrogenase
MRMSTNRAFIDPIRGKRRNLVVLTEAEVTRVLVEKGRAIGVELRWRATQTVRVAARREVILSAGAINSPKILMLSGIGPAQHLISFRIPVVKDLQVIERPFL